ncbi:MAG: RNA polymerase sigma-H factor [Firmicutes bacterium ADurb.Bin193]|nr:MAG: RNA polymerase sigma-H factor [Firmicutes bacterium ADurb.Bin193]
MVFAQKKDCVYALLSDEDVVLLAQQGDTAALEYIFEKYKTLVRARARSYYLIGADKEDIVQEGMIGLYKAVRDFSADKLSGFSVFADLCATRQIVTAIKTATRQKHIPLNTYVSLNKPVYDEESERTLYDVVSEGDTSDPEQIVINEESYVQIRGKIGRCLSDYEWKVLSSYLQGRSYQEISADLKRPVKSIDNALQRIKRKLELQLK